MYNLVSGIAYIAIAPENWIIALLIGIFLAKLPIVKKRLAAIIFLLVLILGNEFIYTRLVINWQPKPVTFSPGECYNAGIVLGGSSSFDKYGRGYLNAASDRFIEACLLYKTQKIRKVIISGGSNAPGQPKDADFQFKKMIDLGIPASDIIVENASVNTYENATFTKKIIDSLQLKPPFVLITSAMHMPRAESVFTKAGLAVLPFPCNYSVLETHLSLSDYLVPKISTFLSWSAFLKEIVGIWGYKLFNRA